MEERECMKYEELKNVNAVMDYNITKNYYEIYQEYRNGKIDEIQFEKNYYKALEVFENMVNELRGEK